MDFRILGPLEVVVDAPVKLGGAQQRALLALLLIHAGETLTTDRLVDELWGERPPPTAVKTVQVYISQLRKLLGAGRVERGGGGYRLVATADEVDARRFEAKVSAGRGALEAGRLADAVATLTEADQLWRGPALAGLDLRWALSAAARLEDLRVAAQEDRIEAELELGRHAALTSELEALCHAHPLRERLVAQRMLALYRSGRQADALEAYRDARERLVGELGLEPGLELRQLERRMLVQDPQLAAPARVLTPTQRRRRGALIGVLVVVVAATAIVALPRDRAVLPAPGPNTAVAVDVESTQAGRADPWIVRHDRRSASMPAHQCGRRPAMPLPAHDGSSIVTARSARCSSIAKRHGFRAGEHRLALQICDDSTARADQVDVERCAANGKAYAANRAVVGVIGPIHSVCAEALVPETEPSTLAVISPSATSIKLTRPQAGQPAVPGRTSARRAFFRVIAPDDEQANVAVSLARRLGAHRLFIVAEASGYGQALRLAADRAARAAGMRILGPAFWDADGRRAQALAREVPAPSLWSAPDSG